MGFDCVGNGLAVNAMGDLYLAATGQSNAATFTDIVVAKIAGINGSLVWLDVVNGAVSGYDQAFGVAVDPSGAVLAIGFTQTSATDVDAWVRKYTDNGITNTIQWTRTFAGLAGGYDAGYSVAADPMGNVLAAGVETVANQSSNVWIRKYDSNGNTVWTQGYNGVANHDDLGLAVVCDKDS